MQHHFALISFIPEGIRLQPKNTEMDHVPPDRLTIERSLWEKGIVRIAGIDEAGRGPLAGPVVAAAVIFGRNFMLDGVKDSKKLSAVQREKHYGDIMNKAITWGVGMATHEEIDAINILQATLLAMRRALSALAFPPDYLLVDGRDLPQLSPSGRAVIKGDDRSFTIAAASIIAKVTRDRLMVALHERYPDYGFDRHKGYGTAAHRDMILKFGSCPVHRLTFLRKILPEKTTG